MNSVNFYAAVGSGSWMGYLKSQQKVLRKFFFSINGFLKAESSEIVQVTLAFCSMRKRRALNYVKVFKVIKNLLLIISVEEIVSYFKRAIFKAVKKCFPGVHHFGCTFHWKQAICVLRLSF